MLQACSRTTTCTIVGPYHVLIYYSNYVLKYYRYMHAVRSTHSTHTLRLDYFNRQTSTTKVEAGVEKRFYVIEYLSIIRETQRGPRGAAPRAAPRGPPWVLWIMLQRQANVSVSPRPPCGAFCNPSMHAARSRGRAGKFTMHGSRLEIRDPESTADRILNLWGFQAPA